MDIENMGYDRSISETDLNFEKIEIDNDSITLDENLNMQSFNHKRIKDLTFEIEDLPLDEMNVNNNKIICIRSNQQFKNINSLIFEFEEL